MGKLPLNYYALGESVVAFTTTRQGGVSQGAYASMNINPFCGDTEANVTANRQLLADELCIDEKHLLVPHQVHGIDSRMIAGEFFSLPERIQTMLLENTDIIMTSESNVCVGVSTADCIPVLLFDEEHHAVAAIHAGWRGTLARIAHKGVADMVHSYSTIPAQLKAVIGPGISMDAFEVGQEVYDAFAEKGYPMEQVAVRKNKWHIDLKAICRMQLEQAGVPHDAIVDADICTYTQHDDYFSARQLGIESGRLYTGIMLRD